MEKGRAVTSSDAIHPGTDGSGNGSAGSTQRRRKNASKYVGFDKATFRVRPDLLDKLRRTSFFERRDMSEIVNTALEQYLPEARAEKS